MTNPTDAGAPTLEPPSATSTTSAGDATVGSSAPSLTDAQLHSLIEQAAPAPSMLPPAAAAAVAGVAEAAAALAQQRQDRWVVVDR